MLRRRGRFVTLKGRNSGDGGWLVRRRWIGTVMALATDALVVQAAAYVTSGAGDLVLTAAAELGVSVRTVKTHVEHLFRELGVTHRSQAATWAAER